MFLELNVTTRGTVGRGRKFARCEKECYKLVRTRHSCGDRMRKSLVIQLASLLIVAAIFVLGSSFPASSGSEGACPPDRPNGTPPECCPDGTTFREGILPAHQLWARDRWHASSLPADVRTPSDSRGQPVLRSLPGRFPRYAAQLHLSAWPRLGQCGQGLQRSAEMHGRHGRHPAQLSMPV